LIRQQIYHNSGDNSIVECRVPKVTRVLRVDIISLNSSSLQTLAHFKYFLVPIFKPLLVYSIKEENLIEIDY